MNVTIDFRELDAQNLEQLYPYCSIEEKDRLLKISGIEHYRLLSFLSTLYNNSAFYSINANERLAAIALSYNTTNQVYSYNCLSQEVDDMNIIPVGSTNPINTHFYNTENFMEQVDIMAQSSIIFIGVPLTLLEYKTFYNILFEKEFNGLVIVNHLCFPDTEHIWNEVSINKINVSRYGNIGGTGIIDYSNVKIFDVTSGGLHNNG